jgi:acetyl-CoA carboxylase alpha subunit
MFIGQQKGRTTQQKIQHNFGMPKPEGYSEEKIFFVSALLLSSKAFIS